MTASRQTKQSIQPPASAHLISNRNIAQFRISPNSRRTNIYAISNRNKTAYVASFVLRTATLRLVNEAGSSVPIFAASTSKLLAYSLESIRVGSQAPPISPQVHETTGRSSHPIHAHSGRLATIRSLLSLQSENVRFVQSRNVRFHRRPRGRWKRSGLR
jgi:hypothetical protein